MSDKRSSLSELLGADLAEEVLGKTQSKADALSAMGIESKDLDTSDATEEAPSEANAEEAVEPEADTEVTNEGEPAEIADESLAVDNEEDVEGVATSEPVSALVEAITENVVKSVNESLHIEDLSALVTQILTNQKDIQARMDVIEVADEVKVEEGIAKEMNQPPWAGFKASEEDSTLLDNVLEEGTERPKGPKTTDSDDDAENTLMKFMNGAGLGFADGGK